MKEKMRKWMHVIIKTEMILNLYCKTRKYGALLILAPLAQLPPSAKINSAATNFHMY